MENKRSGHVLAVPYPSQGHINPMINFCTRLVSKGLKVTLLPTRFISKSFPLRQPSPIQIDTISDGYDEAGFAQADDIQSYLTRLADVGFKTLTQLIIKYQNSEHPIVCVVYDAFMPWAQDVAKRFGLVSAAFFTQPCAVNYVYFLAHHGKMKLPVSATDFCEVPGLPMLGFESLPSFVSVPGSYPAYFELVLNQFSNADKADFVLCNTFFKLEEQEVALLSKFFRLLTIGPTIPSFYLDKKLGNDKDYGLDLFTSISTTCTNWLDTKPKGSVVYVSFGSMANLSNKQMEELAWGLKQSNVFFLWVLRSTNEKSKLPEKFVEETSDKGLIINWSAQLEVLSNKAIGCFLTHCGWNSTFEALSLGVPMVTMPQWTDQPTNAKYVEDVWKVGVKVKVDVDRIAKREEIEFCIREVMHSERRKEIEKNAEKWKELAVEAMCEGGTSDNNIASFVSSLLR